MKKYKLIISLSILLIFHAVGIAGIGFELSPKMQDLSWLNLLLTALVVWLNKPENGKSFIYFSLLVFVLGLGVEILGVATGFPFGNYYYGTSLGIKVFEVPLILGLNWWLLVYNSIQISGWITSNKLIRTIIAPAFMLGMDMFIEPLCAILDFWFWKDEIVPTENYISWYFIALVFSGIYFKWIETKKINTVGAYAFIIQIIFFGILNLLR